MKKGLFCIAVMVMLIVVMGSVVHAEQKDGLYCDLSALTFDEMGNPTHDENGEKLIYGACLGEGYLYLRSDYSAVCTGIRQVEHYSAIQEFYSLVKTLYIGEGVLTIDCQFLNSCTSLEKVRITNGVKVIDFSKLNEKSFDLSVQSESKAEILMITAKAEEQESLLKDLSCAYDKIVVKSVRQDGSDAMYVYKDEQPYNGFFEYDGDTYYSHEDGKINSLSEVRVDGLLYRFDKKGVLIEGPIYDTIGIKSTIIASGKRGWVEFMGKTYYVSLVSGEFNEKSALKIGGVLRHFNDDFSVKEGLLTEDDGVTQRYYVKGEYKIGWIDTDNDGTKESYFLSANGIRVMESRKIGGKMYECENGVLKPRQGIFEENGSYYYYKDGVRVSGFVDDNGKTYYFLSESKKMVTAQSYTIRGYHREFNSDHSIKPISGWQEKAGVRYYFENGQCVTGFKKIDGYTYYFKKSDNEYGAMASGWISIGGDVYYFFRYGTEKYGRMATGRQTISSNVYYFNSDGTINSGFVGDSGGNVHYYHYSQLLKGWYIIGGNTYYFTKEQGNMITGDKSIGGIKYSFSDKGVLQGPAYDGAVLISGATSGTGSGFDISDGNWSDIIIF